MPKPLKFKEQFDPFHQWVNELRINELNPDKFRFSFTDIDGLSFADRPEIQESWFYLLETKAAGKDWIDHNQNFGLNLIDTICGYNDSRLFTILDRGGYQVKRKLKYFGKHFLSMSGLRPDQSEELLFDGRQISLTTLIKIIRFELNPVDFSLFMLLSPPENEQKRLESAMVIQAEWLQKLLNY